MSFYNNLQNKVSEYRATQEQYWIDLQLRMARFQPGLISYLGADGLELCDSKDNKYPIVAVGELKGDFVETVPSVKFQKIDGDQNCLHFYVQVNLSKANSEIIDIERIFECYFWRKHDNYTMNIDGVNIMCVKVLDKTDFTSAYDAIYQNLEKLVDKTRYE